MTNDPEEQHLQDMARKFRYYLDERIRNSPLYKNPLMDDKPPTCGRFLPDPDLFTEADYD